MLQFSKNTLTLREELHTAQPLIKKILCALKNVNSKTNLTETIGVFIPQLPEFRILSRDFGNVKGILRKVCSGEVLIEDALYYFNCANQEIDYYINLYNNLPEFPQDTIAD